MSRSTVKVMTHENGVQKVRQAVHWQRTLRVGWGRRARSSCKVCIWNVPTKMYAQLLRSSAKSCFFQLPSSRCVSPNRRSPSVQDQYRWKRQNKKNHVGRNTLLITHDFFQRSWKCLKFSQFQERLFTKCARFSRVPKDTRSSTTFKGGERSFSELKKLQCLFPTRNHSPIHKHCIHTCKWTTNSHKNANNKIT